MEKRYSNHSTPSGLRAFGQAGIPPPVPTPFRETDSDGDAIRKPKMRENSFYNPGLNITASASTCPNSCTPTN